MRGNYAMLDNLFQSTLPLRGATGIEAVHIQGNVDFNPRSPCGERRLTKKRFTGYLQFQSTLPLRGATTSSGTGKRSWIISIHAPLAGSDDGAARHSAGPGISIHAPLAGSDLLLIKMARCMQDISIHAPLAGSDESNDQNSTDNSEFQSTLPLRGATVAAEGQYAFNIISIHAPLAGSDGAEAAYVYIAGKFQSTLPLRGATCCI